jgi:hypothetical protein
MVGHVRGFLQIANDSLAEVVDLLQRSRLWAGAEVQVQDSVYDRIPSVDFSREVLSVQTPRMLALRMAGTGWSDLGHPERVLTVLQAAGLAPWWMKRWETSQWDLVTKPVTRQPGA